MPKAEEHIQKILSPAHISRVTQVSKWDVRLHREGPEDPKTLSAPPWSLGEGRVSDTDTPQKGPLEGTALVGSARGSQ